MLINLYLNLILSLSYLTCPISGNKGVILFEMIVGQPPFLAATPEETQNKVIIRKIEGELKD